MPIHRKRYLPAVLKRNSVHPYRLRDGRSAAAQRIELKILPAFLRILRDSNDPEQVEGEWAR